jgi:hypothetical protein
MQGCLGFEKSWWWRRLAHFKVPCITYCIWTSIFCHYLIPTISLLVNVKRICSLSLKILCQCLIVPQHQICWHWHGTTIIQFFFSFPVVLSLFVASVDLLNCFPSGCQLKNLMFMVPSDFSLMHANWHASNFGGSEHHVLWPFPSSWSHCFAALSYFFISEFI